MRVTKKIPTKRTQIMYMKVANYMLSSGHLAALEEYIERGGIDQVWSETGLYKFTTIGKIIKGKHLYRAIEADFITMLRH